MLAYELLQRFLGLVGQWMSSPEVVNVQLTASGYASNFGLLAIATAAVGLAIVRSRPSS